MKQAICIPKCCVFLAHFPSAMFLQIWLLSPQKLCSLDSLVLCFQSLLSVGKPGKPRVTRATLLCPSLHDAKYHPAKIGKRLYYFSSYCASRAKLAHTEKKKKKQVIKYKRYWRRTREGQKVVVLFDQMIMLICSVKAHLLFLFLLCVHFNEFVSECEI